MLTFWDWTRRSLDTKSFKCIYTGIPLASSKARGFLELKAWAMTTTIWIKWKRWTWQRTRTDRNSMLLVALELSSCFRDQSCTASLGRENKFAGTAGIDDRLFRRLFWMPTKQKYNIFNACVLNNLHPLPNPLPPFVRSYEHFKHSYFVNLSKTSNCTSLTCAIHTKSE